MKKRFSLLLVLTLLLSIISGPVVAAEQPETRVTVDGKILEFDVPPTIIDGRTLVPLRAIFEALGVEPEWDGETSTVTATKGNITISLTIGNKYATVSGKQVELEVPAQLVADRTMVPARFIAESLDANVGWDADTRTVIITSALEIPIHFIDVGQADAIFIDAGDYDILIDAGNKGDGDTVVSYIRGLNTDDIELMIATHPHEDHIGGLDDVLAAFDVETIIDSGKSHTSQTYKDYYNAAQAEEANFIEDDDMTFTIAPGIEFIIIETGDDYSNLNNVSVVSLLHYDDVQILFTGDMEADVERTMLNNFPDIDILKVGHHGSNSSSSPEFLNKTKPEVAVISCGTGNTYGHPHEETLKALSDRNIGIYRTDEVGHITITTNGKTYTVNKNSHVYKPTEGTAPFVPTTQTQSSGTGQFVGSTQSDKYHYPSCRYAKTIKSKNQIWFESVKDAKAHGYLPCGTCKPPAN